MSIEYKTIMIKFNERYSNYFDTIFNAEIGNRKSDIGLIEKDRPMIRPRLGTSRVGSTVIGTWSSSTAYVVGDYVVYNSLVYKCTTGHTNSTPPSVNWTLISSPGQSKGLFYTDRKGARRLYRVFDGTLQYMNDTTWTNLKTGVPNTAEMSIQRLPMNIIPDWNSATAYVVGNKVYYNGVTYLCATNNTNSAPPNANWTTSDQDSTEYTVAAVSSSAEKIKKAAGDTLNANNNVGKILLITFGIYKGCYAPIISYDTVNAEYSLG